MITPYFLRFNFNRLFDGVFRELSGFSSKFQHFQFRAPTTYLESTKMTLKSSVARNMNMFECILISVMADGGSEFPTATRPIF